MRRREVVLATPGKIPPEFLLGRCIEVWGVEPPGSPDINWPHRPALQAHSRSSAGLHAYAESIGVEWSTPAWNHIGKKAKGVPWSISFMIASGRANRVEDRLTSAGVTLADVPRLQRAAQGWVDMWEARRVRT